MIVDDHVLFAEAIGAAMDDAGIEVSGAVGNGLEAIRFLQDERVDVVLMDIGLPDRSGLAVGREILERWPEIKVLAVTALDDPRAVDDAIRMGFSGYLTKDTSVARFIASMEAILEGQVVVPHRLVSVGRRREAPVGIALLVAQLTSREREVLGLLVEGADGETIARRLGISRNTVRTHVQSILTKLQVHSRLEAATFAVRHSLVPLPSVAAISARGGIAERVRLRPVGPAARDDRLGREGVQQPQGYLMRTSYLAYGFRCVPGLRRVGTVSFELLARVEGCLERQSGSDPSLVGGSTRLVP